MLGITRPSIYSGVSAHDLGGAYHNADTKANFNSKLSDASLVEIKTGTYVGDDTVDQNVTGAGFQPLYVYICYAFGSAGNEQAWERWALADGDKCVWHSTSTANYHRVMGSDLISLDADGFSVDDSGGNAHPNKNTNNYDYFAIGN